MNVSAGTRIPLTQTKYVESIGHAWEIDHAYCNDLDADSYETSQQAASMYALQ